MPSSTFEDVVVSAFDHLFSPTVVDIQGGPHWPDFHSRTFERHRRYMSAVDLAPADDAAMEMPVVSGHHVWLGPIVGHFGHQVAEFSHRILPSLTTHPDALLLVATRSERADSRSMVNADWRFPTSQDMPRYALEVLEWLGGDRRDIRVVTSPMRVERLSVVGQGEQFGGAADDWYLDQLDALMRERPISLARQEAIYVSRAGMRFGKIAGEAYIERLAASSGIRVVRPETLSLEDQLCAYRSADLLIFAEGSALHSLGLLGRGLAKVAVVKRRNSFQDVWRSQAAGRVDEFTEINAVDTCFPSEDSWTGLTCIDPERVIEGFARLGIDLGAHFKAEAWAESVIRDLATFRDDLANPRFGLGVAPADIPAAQARILDYERALVRQSAVRAKALPHGHE